MRFSASFRCLKAAPAIACLLLCGLVLVDRAEPANNLPGGGRRQETMSGHFRGAVVTLFLDPELVESWLPRGLRLAEDAPFEDHPVVLLFGTQTDLTREGTITFKPRYARNGRYFHEAFVAIPYLELDQGSTGGPVFHFVRVYLDHPKPASQGARRAGWPKLLAAVEAGDEGYRISRPPWGTIFEAETDYADARPVDPKSDRFEPIRAMLSRPLVLKHEGRFDFYRFDFHFDSATIEAVSSHVELHEGFLPGIGRIAVSRPGIDRSPFGAFRLDCRYTKTAMN